MTKFVCVLAMAAGLAAAGPKSYNLKLFQKSTLAGKTLSPGDYRVEIVDQKAVIRSGRTVVEAPVTVETGDSKYKTSYVRLVGGGDAPRIETIKLGGTNLRLVFNTDAAAGADRSTNQ
jgi:hypothetical protein